MLKKFFIAMLGSMAGMWLSMLFFVLLVIAAIGMIVGASAGKNTTPEYERGILRIDLAGDIPERNNEQTINDMLLNGISKGQTFSDIVTSIRMAASDRKIEGIYLNCTGSQMGLASRTEVWEALKNSRRQTNLSMPTPMPTTRAIITWPAWPIACF